MTISDLTKKLQMNRNLVAKTLDMLIIAGQVEMQPVGAAKVYFLAQRVPVSSMLEFSSDLVIMIDRNRKILYVNERVPILLEIQREILEGKRIDEIDHHFFKDLNLGAPDPAPADGVLREQVAERNSHLGTTNRFFRIKKIPTAFEDGSQGFTFLIEDITPQKTYQQMLEASEARYRGLVMSSGEAIIGSAPDGEITNWNPAAERLFGYSEKEILHQPFGRLATHGASPDLEQLLADIRKGECIQGHDLQMLSRSGTLIDALITICPVRDGDGTITGASSIIRDITYEKLDEHARMYEDQYRTLVDDVKVGVYRSTGDPRGQFVWGNTALIKILGFDSLEDLRGIKVTDVFSKPDGRAQLLDALRRQGFVKNRVLSLKRGDGSPLTVNVTALAEFDANNDLIFINGIVQDISGAGIPGEDSGGQAKEMR
ncbi:MAG TPA: PAS domain S-box protein [Methanoregula sp.]|nr:PAS domain S-box protein [Methanoregula sp.]